MKNVNTNEKKKEETTKNLIPVAVDKTEASESGKKEAANKENNNNESKDKEGNKDANLNVHHPTREENISLLIITPETQRINSDELLTKEDESIMHDFQRLKGEITTIPNQKIDYAEILDDKWSTFAK